MGWGIREEVPAVTSGAECLHSPGRSSSRRPSQTLWEPDRDSQLRATSCQKAWQERLFPETRLPGKDDLRHVLASEPSSPRTCSLKKLFFTTQSAEGLRGQHHTVQGRTPPTVSRAHFAHKKSELNSHALTVHHCFSDKILKT